MDATDPAQQGQPMPVAPSPVAPVMPNPATQSMAPPQTLMAFASMDPLLGPLLAANDDPDYAEALMMAARNKGLA